MLLFYTSFRLSLFGLWVLCLNLRALTFRLHSSQTETDPQDNFDSTLEAIPVAIPQTMET